MALPTRCKLRVRVEFDGNIKVRCPLELGAKAITRIDFVIKIDFHQVLQSAKAPLIFNTITQLTHTCIGREMWANNQFLCAAAVLWPFWLEIWHVPLVCCPVSACLILLTGPFLTDLHSRINLPVVKSSCCYIYFPSGLWLLQPLHEFCLSRHLSYKRQLFFRLLFIRPKLTSENNTFNLIHHLIL